MTTREWVKRAKGRLPVTDAAWVMTQLHANRRLRAFWADLYDAAEVPLVWRLNGGAPSITRNIAETGRIRFRSDGFRRMHGHPARMIATRLRGIRRVGRRQGREIIDVALAALATRHREVYSFSHANADEVYLAPLGCGTQAAIFGVLPDSRLCLEGNYGYLLLSNGVPIGYGGVSPIFHQANTGINVFEEYRRSEATYLFAQTLRVFHTLFGCTLFVANPYQFGADNTEAIGSSAFWFYYRLGFRPVDADIAKLARDQVRRLRRRPSSRSEAKTLRALSRCDLLLKLSGARRGDLFEESRLGICAAGATRLIAEFQEKTRNRAIARVVQRVAGTLRATHRSRWPDNERRSFEEMAPVVGVIGDLNRWHKNDKVSLVRLMRAKGCVTERDYVLRLGRHDRFRRSLEHYCRKAADE